MQPNLYAEGLTSDDVKRQGQNRNKGPMAETPKSSTVKGYWREIERYNRATQDWREAAKQIENLYLDEDRGENTSSRRYALLWANVETLKPAVYARIPNVQCSRRYKDRDPIARTAAELMERATNTSFDLYDVDETFQMVRNDRLLPGRGQAWVRYEATIEQYEDDENEGPETEQITQGILAGLPGSEPIGADDEDDAHEEAEIFERLKDERVCVDYVHWADFGHNVAGTWSDVWLVWRCVYKTQEEITERFGAEKAAKCAYNAKAPASLPERISGAAADVTEEFCRIYECWDRRKRRVTWITEGMRMEPLDEGEPPVNFSGFFPCPRPCYATKISRSLIPRPDYAYYRDQAKEINDLTDKIANMTGWLVVKGFVPGSPSRVSDSIEEIIRDKGNRELFTQVDSWQEWTERGGISKLIDWMPIDMIVATIQAAISARNQLIQDVFQITGISDILRGQSDPNETLGAQQLKAQTGSSRIRNTKDEIARFCRDIGRLTAEVIAEKFEPETIAALTGYTYKAAEPIPAALGLPMPDMALPGTMPAQQADIGQQMQLQEASGPSLEFDDAVMDLLRNDRLRSFRIDVETDSTIQADEDAEKSRRVEFLQATSSFMQQSVQAIQAVPELASLQGEMLMFAVRGFRAGRQLEEEIERTFGSIQQKAIQASQAQPQPNPEQLKAQAQMQQMQAKAQQDAAKHQADMESKRLETQASLAISQAQLQQIQAESAAKAQEHGYRMQEMQMKAHYAAQQATERAMMWPAA